MENSSNILKTIIKKDSIAIKDSFSGPNYHALQHILRRLDVILVFYNNDPNLTKEEVEKIRHYYDYGWPLVFKLFYSEINIDEHIPFPEMYPQARDWAESVILYSGKIAALKQLLAFEKADLIKFETPKENEISFKFITEISFREYFDRKSIDFFKEEIIGRFIEKEKQNDKFDKDEILEELRSIIRNPSGKYISYDSTPKLEEYYNRQGYYHILRLQGYDDFNENDMFGGIPYWKYLKLIENIAGVAFLHIEACVELSKINPKVDIHNLLTYTHYKDKIIAKYAKYWNTSSIEIEQIFSCITLNKDNFEYYLEYPSVSCPMFIQVSKNMLVRLIAGCLGNPFELLNRELKRRFKKDYDIAVNGREERFRNQLYNLFPQDYIITIPNGINIKMNNKKTDIDAIIYDSKNQTLGLFQLKWQDPFYASMKERFSRITNLFRKAEEWIEKVEYWLNNLSPKSMINSLQIDRYSSEKLKINEIYIFVLSRYNINFTNNEFSDNAAWGTWYQFMEAQTKITTGIENPIADAFVKLKMFTPENRMEAEENSELEDFNIQLGKYKISMDNK